MRKLLLIAGLSTALAGCNNGPSTEESARKTGDIRLENATAEEVIKQASAAQGKNKIQAGEWEDSIQLVSADMPGVPEMVRKEMEAESKKPPEVRKTCKKDEDIKAIDFTKLAPQANGCTFPKYVVADGKIEANMECKGPFGPIRMSISGTQTPTSYDVTMAQSQALPGGKAESKLTMRASGKRLGNCTA
ncbi:MAG: DUF3617 domain-containing protein [Alphaproteobacteria bacterium]|nr:MAG: DUF3617 domain-containing protein [Alphaproteobacteria bacterium]